jgi:hypothetical protein
MRNEQEALEDVLDAYVASNSVPSQQALKEWIRRYPNYRRELIEFTVSWTMIEHLPPSPDVDEIDEELLVVRGMSVVQRIMDDRKQKGRADEERNEVHLRSLLDEGSKLGLSIREMAAACRLGIQTFRKLDRRLISYPSIPSKVLQVIAETIRRSVDAVASYLQREPTYAKGSRYRAEQRPEVARQESFFEAIRSDATIEEVDRSYWLTFEQTDGEE